MVVPAKPSEAASLASQGAARHPPVHAWRCPNENPAGCNPAGLDLAESQTLPDKEAARTHFNELLTEVNLSLRLLPKPFTTAIIASAIPAAIRPYSIAVAPDSSDKKFDKVRFKPASSGVPSAELEWE